MKHVSILVPLGHTSLPNIDGTHQILNEVNKFLEQMGREPLFDVKLVGLKKEIPQRSGLFTVKPDLLIDDVKHTDLVIIPAIHENFEKA
ncbi:MAG: AraC family transcriptional regulator, partial [Bacteroidota bacterium]|nr:AraC family transcriptional regulator [Bacteroidota bacterium]